QKQQQEQEAFLERLLPYAASARVEADRRNDDDGLDIGVEPLDGRPERREFRLQRVELRDNFRFRKIQGLTMKRFVHGRILDGNGQRATGNRRVITLTGYAEVARPEQG